MDAVRNSAVRLITMGYFQYQTRSEVKTIEIEELATKHKTRDAIFDPASLIADCQKLEIISGERILCTYAYLFLAFKMLCVAVLRRQLLREGNSVGRVRAHPPVLAAVELLKIYSGYSSLC